MSSRRLTRSENDKMIAGVCGGLAEYLDLDPVIIRLAFFVLTFAGGIGLPTYLIMALITPRESDIDEDRPIYEEIHFSEGTETHDRNRSSFFAGLLILLGLFFLMGNLGIDMGILLPIGLIAFGIWQIVGRQRG